MKKFVAAGVVVAGLAGGSVAVAAVAPFGVAGAHDRGAPGSEHPPMGSEHPHLRGRAGAMLGGALAALVEDGTIDQELADKLRERIREHSSALRDRLAEKMPGLGMKVGASLEQVAGMLGLGVDELHAQIRDGRTLGEIAGDRKDELIEALVDAAHARIDAAVESGKLPAERADALKERTAAQIERLVEEVPRHGRHGAFSGPR